MEELLQKLATEPDKVIASIKEKSKDSNLIQSYQKEYKEHDRTIRDTQVGSIQKDKTVGTGEKSRQVKSVKIPINFAKKIVTTSSAFEVGKPVTLISSEDNNLSMLIKQLWKVNRMDSLIQKLVTLKKSETQGAIQFYINDLKENSILNKILVKIGLKSQAKEIKVKLLDNTTGVMTPYFDATGNMTLFMWQYQSKNTEGKIINNTQIWDEKNYHYLNDESGNMEYADSVKIHGFDRIPVVYVSQDEPEWFDVKELIDRIETSISKLGSSNDYTAYPLLKLFGEVQSFPDKDESGKVLMFPIQKDENDKLIQGNAEFLTADNATESAQLELDKLESFIYSISSTPNLSFDNVKGISGISGIALKLMFLDAMMKASMNEGDNRTMIERMINIIVSGIVNTTNTTLAKESDSLYYDIQFNSILPDDLKEAVETVSAAVNAKVMSRKTAVEYLGMNEDVDDELTLIADDAKVPSAEPAAT